MFFIKLLSRPRFFIFSSNYLSLLFVSIIMSNLCSNALYFTIKSLISSSFSDNNFLRFSISLSLLLILSSKYSFNPISWVPKNYFILVLSSSIAALDYSWRFSIKPFDKPSSWAIEEFTSWRCSYCFFNLRWFFYSTSILSSSSLIYCIYF